MQSVSGPGGTRGYQYDANGNLTSVTGPAPRTVTWWSHNKPRRMTRNADNYSEYWYGPGGDRDVFKQESRIAGALSTVIYGSALYERRTQGATVEHTHYIQANGVTVATVRRYGTSTANTTRYLHRDHLGSVVLITNESGAVTETLAYDAWGKRRPPSNWVTPGAGTFLHAQWLRRGFTAHEHIDHVGLIHMGGRVYDPEIGRFLSPDPFVQYPGSAQGMNRYAYVGNNPLSFTDPSGYFIKKFGKPLAIVAAVVIPNPILAGAVAGFLASGGQLKGAVFGAIGGAVFGAIGNAFSEVTFGSGLHLSKTLAHGVAGGLLSAAGGGRFGDGFLGAGVGQLFAPGIDRIGLDSAGEIRADVSARIVRTATAATVGGTASAIGGGKFANGAISAGFGRAFNDEVHIRDRHFARLRIQRVLSVAYDSDAGFGLEFEPMEGFRVQKVGSKYMISQGSMSLTVDENKVSGSGWRMRGRTHSMNVNVSALGNGQLSIKGSYSYSSVLTFGIARTVAVEGMVMNSSGLLGNAARAVHSHRRQESVFRSVDCQVSGDCP